MEHEIAAVRQPLQVGIHLIFADPATTVYSDLQWLPDGSDLVFHVQIHNTASNTDTSLIETVNVDGGGTRTIVSGQDPVVPTYITRLAGATRVDTAVSVSRATFTTAPAIVVARDDLFPDALAAGPLAAKLHGPLLLSPPTGVTTALASEVKRLGARTAYLVGDTGIECERRGRPARCGCREHCPDRRNDAV